MKSKAAIVSYSDSSEDENIEESKTSSASNQLNEKTKTPDEKSCSICLRFI